MADKKPAPKKSILDLDRWVPLPTCDSGPYFGQARSHKHHSARHVPCPTNSRANQGTTGSRSMLSCHSQLGHCLKCSPVDPRDSCVCAASYHCAVHKHHSPHLLVLSHSQSQSRTQTQTHCALATSHADLWTRRSGSSSLEGEKVRSMMADWVNWLAGNILCNKCSEARVEWESVWPMNSLTRLHNTQPARPWLCTRSR